MELVTSNHISEETVNVISILEQNKPTQSTVLFNQIQTNAEVYKKAILSNEQAELNKLMDELEESNDIWHDYTLYKQVFEPIAFPIFHFPEETDLAIREEGYITTASLIELVGAIENVKVSRTYNKKTENSKEANSTQTRKVLWDEVSHYGLNRENVQKLFSKSAIKQFLLFHMLPVDNEGCLFDVPYEKIAEKLNVSVRTVQNNNRALSDAGLISIEKDRVKHFNYTLSRYENKGKQGSSGYIKMSKKTLETLLGIDEVNTLRLTIRLYLRTIQEIARKTRYAQEAPKYTMDELKSILPSYKTNPLSIKRMLEEINHLFQHRLIGDEVYFIMENTHNPEVQQSELNKTINQVTLYLVKHYVSAFDKKDKSDLIQLANQYGLAKFLSAIKLFINSPYMIERSEEFSIGVVLRSLLRFNSLSRSEFPLFMQ